MFIEQWIAETKQDPKKLLQSLKRLHAFSNLESIAFDLVEALSTLENRGYIDQVYHVIQLANDSQLSTDLQVVLSNQCSTAINQIHQRQMNMVARLSLAVNGMHKKVENRVDIQQDHSVAAAAA